MKQNEALEKILQAREKRDALEKKLLAENKNKTLITVRANYPGTNKNTMQAHLISYHCFLTLVKIFTEARIYHTLTAEGLVFFLLVNENPFTVKKKTITVEETFFLGRLIDIDVRDGEKLFSREDINIKRRKCLLCENDAVLCVRSRKHSIAELLGKINGTVEEIFYHAKSKQELLEKIIRTAMLEELCREYSFGCVNVNGNGSHRDMNFLLMLKGIDIVCESIAALKNEDIKNFTAARQHGIPFEKKLFTVCGGVNTYKGAHFLLLILAAAVLNGKNFIELQKYIAEFSYDCLADLPGQIKNPKLHTLGVRGEAASGFKNHFELYVPLLENGASYTEVSLKILTNTFDTTTIKRGGIEKLKYIQDKARSAKIIADVEALNAYCIANNLSTGGIADNFIITVALYLLKKYGY